MRFGMAAGDPGQAEDALVPCMGEIRRLKTDFDKDLCALCTTASSMQPIHLLHDISYNQDLGRAIKWDFLSGSKRMLIDV